MAGNAAVKIVCTHQCRKATVIIGVVVSTVAAPSSPTSKMALVVAIGLVKVEGLEVTTTDLNITKEATIIAITTNSATTRSHPFTITAHTKAVIPQRVALPMTCLIITVVTVDLRNVKAVIVVSPNNVTVKIAVVVLNIQTVPIKTTIDAKT